MWRGLASHLGRSGAGRSLVESNAGRMGCLFWYTPRPIGYVGKSVPRGTVAVNPSVFVASQEKSPFLCKPNLADVITLDNFLLFHELLEVIVVEEDPSVG